MTPGSNKRKMLLAGLPRETAYHISETASDIELTQIENAGAVLTSSGLDAYDLILIDQNVQGMAGIELLEKLIYRNIRPPLVFMAARGQEDAVARAIEAGAAHYAVKDPDGEYFKIISAILKRYPAASRPAGDEIRDRQKEDAAGSNNSPNPSADAGQSSPEQRSRPDINRRKQPETRRLYILLAEDNPFNKKVAVSVLEMKGHTVKVVDNGQQAVDAFQKGGYDLILMDIQMPEMDGLEASRRIRALEKGKCEHIPIIALTAFGAKTDRESCLKAGMDEYLLKPYKPSELFETIDKLIENGGRGAGTGEKKEREGDCDDVFSKKTIMAIAGGKEKLVKELIKLFLDNIESPLNDLKEGIRLKDGNQVRFGAHSLKGMSLNLSAKKVAQRALELETIGKQGSFDEGPEKLNELENEIERLKKAVASFVNDASCAEQ